MKKQFEMVKIDIWDSFIRKGKKDVAWILRGGHWRQVMYHLTPLQRIAEGFDLKDAISIYEDFLKNPGAYVPPKQFGLPANQRRKSKKSGG